MGSFKLNDDSPNPANLEFPSGGVLEVVDRVAEGHQTQWPVDAIVHPEGLEAQDHSVHFVSYPPAVLVCLGLEGFRFNNRWGTRNRRLKCRVVRRLRGKKSGNKEKR